MKKTLVLLSIVVMAGCASSSDKEVIKLIPGPQGPTGAQGPVGTNGHSIVSNFIEATDFECDNGGTRLDMYLDKDDSLTVSDGDLFENSLIACNGADGTNGSDGSQGLQGVAGEQGPQGIAGEVGPQGDPGAAGPTGATGIAGPTGPTGPTGPQGLPGVPGTNGSSAVASIVAYISSSCVHVSSTSFYTKPNGGHNSFYTGSTCASNTKSADLTTGGSFWVSSNQLAVDV